MGFSFDSGNVFDTLSYELTDYLPGSTAMAFKIEILDILEKAISITPYRTGWLRSSASFTSYGTATRDKMVTILLEYGAEYAALIHENPMGNSFVVGRDHFLEVAVAEGSIGLQDRISNRVKRAGGGLKGYNKLRSEFNNKKDSFNTMISNYYNEAITYRI